MSKYFAIIILSVYFFHLLAYSEKITYVSIEHPFMTFVNKSYLDYFNISSRRHSRRNPIYYVDIKFYTKVNMGNNIVIDFYFYEFLTNVYKRSFVEMRFGICNLVKEDQFFGNALRQGKLEGPCPYPPGAYNLMNMTILPEAIPPGFPFTKGRIYANASTARSAIIIASGHVDMEIRHLKINRTRNTKL